MIKRNTKYGLLILIALILAGCVPPQPKNTDNVCDIFFEYPTWYWATQKSQKRWGVPINVQMAILFQESAFNGTAKPPRGRILWVIPWFRPSSAYGYAQALDGTWDHYISKTGNSGADRDSFADATDFVGWYGNNAYRQAGIPKNSAYALYLAYHDGIGGYQRGTYKSKPWLMGVARKVSARAARYQSQLNSCQSKLPEKHWWQFWY